MERTRLLFPHFILICSRFRRAFRRYRNLSTHINYVQFTIKATRIRTYIVGIDR